MRLFNLKTTKRVFVLTARGNSRDNQLDTDPTTFEMFTVEQPTMQIDVSSALNLIPLTWGTLKWGTTFKWGFGSQEKITSVVSARIFNATSNALVYNIPVVAGNNLRWGSSLWGRATWGPAITFTSNRILVTIPGPRLQPGTTYKLVAVFTIDGVRNLVVRAQIKTIEQAGIND